MQNLTEVMIKTVSSTYTSGKMLLHISFLSAAEEVLFKAIFQDNSSSSNFFRLQNLTSKIQSSANKL